MILFMAWTMVIIFVSVLLPRSPIARVAYWHHTGKNIAKLGVHPV